MRLWAVFLALVILLPSLWLLPDDARAESEVSEPVVVDPVLVVDHDPASRIVAWFNVGGTSSSNLERQVNFHNNSDQGPYHEWFVNTKVPRLLDKGVERIQLHNPFGKLSPDIELMPFDGYVNASRDVPLLTQGFVEAWKPITARGIEVIGYIGSPHNDIDQINLEHDMDAWWERAWRCVNPLIEAGMSIGLDNSAPRGNASLTFLLAETLREMGVRVYVEARPHQDTPHWFDYPVILLSDTWNRTNPGEAGKHPAVYGRFPYNEQLTGEIGRMVRRGDWVNKPYLLRDSLDDGSTMVVGHSIPEWEDATTVSDFLKLIEPDGVPTNIDLPQMGLTGDLNFTITAPPAHGILTDAPNVPARWTYRPTPDDSGRVRFEYEVNNSTTLSGPHIVEIVVRPYSFQDISLEITDPPDTIGLGEDAVTRVQVQNHGTEDATVVIHLFEEKEGKWESLHSSEPIQLPRRTSPYSPIADFENIVTLLTTPTESGEQRYLARAEIVDGNEPLQNFTTLDLDDHLIDDNEAIFTVLVEPTPAPAPAPVPPPEPENNSTSDPGPVLEKEEPAWDLNSSEIQAPNTLVQEELQIDGPFPPLVAALVLLVVVVLVIRRLKTQK